MIIQKTDPGRVKKEIVGTVPTIVNVSGESIRSIQRTRLLPKLPEAPKQKKPKITQRVHSFTRPRHSSLKISATIPISLTVPGLGMFSLVG